MWQQRAAGVGALLLLVTRPSVADRSHGGVKLVDETPQAIVETLAPPAQDGVTRPNSVSCGAVNRGALAGAAELPRHGVGYTIPEPWWSRDRRYGTEEMIELLQRVAAAVDDRHPGAVLGVGDVAARDGGPLSGHISHQSGRDADLIFYAIDPAGRPLPPDQHMAYYTYSGRAYYARAPEWANPIPERYFDVVRNWALVEALLTDPVVHVQNLFVSRRVRRWLLMYAERTQVSPELIARARAALQRPRGAGSHNDHMHVRLGCTSDDTALGSCKDRPYPRRRNRRRLAMMCPSPVPYVMLPR